MLSQNYLDILIPTIFALIVEKHIPWKTLLITIGTKQNVPPAFRKNYLHYELFKHVTKSNYPSNE